MNKILEIKNLCYTYPDGTHALNNINFSLNKAETLAIIGGNGAGKTTFLLHLNGTILPSNGSITVNEISVNKKNIKQIRQKVGMVFQNPDDQLFMSKVYDDIAFGPNNMRLPLEEIEKRVNSSLEAVGMSDYNDRHPWHLSTGEKKRIAIASVLSMTPDILALDEPSSGLDPKGRRLLIELLKSFSHAKVIATHDLDLVFEIATKVIILHNGKIQAEGTPEEIFSQIELLESCFLEQPLSYKLKNKLF
jgi:cobalt/nickel transport system ATP-binding protein